MDGPMNALLNLSLVAMMVGVVFIAISLIPAAWESLTGEAKKGPVTSALSAGIAILCVGFAMFVAGEVATRKFEGDGVLPAVITAVKNIISTIGGAFSPSQ